MVPESHAKPLQSRRPDKALQMKGIGERRVWEEACPRACSRHSGISPDAIAGRPARSDSTAMMPAIVSTMATPAVAAVSKLRILAQNEPATV